MTQQNKRSEFSRKRGENGNRDTTWINDRNKVYTNKLDRAYGDYVKTIRSNMERGTAL